jgi:hypothetical protein
MGTLVVSVNIHVSLCNIYGIRFANLSRFANLMPLMLHEETGMFTNKICKSNIINVA